MKILHFADLHLGVESYGRIDPASGFSSRFHDFLSTLDQVVDYALENKVDLVLFCGDVLVMLKYTHLIQLGVFHQFTKGLARKLAV